ncbi:MAG: asparagine synthase (glutamine-hydrolyzing) [Candidatus Omnitrophica bacterium]|nr:asparagine synthase (glutamine-hydrolyzing) [Candidatus Omnitrophota bacterium]
MCGICGFAGLDDLELLKRMTTTLSHRGPDEGGIFLNNRRWRWADGYWQVIDGSGAKNAFNAGLGHRRLSIIDLEKGWQPISNEDGSIWLVSNGEIYNYRQLREELIGKGHGFYTNSDAEVIVHLYEEYGEEFPLKLNGMFALAIWDSRTNRLLLVRDRIGIRQLYYLFDGGKLIFASEMKSILHFPSFKKEINCQALDAFLTFRYVPGPETIFGQIRKLPPASMLVFKDGEIKISRYWQIGYNQMQSSGSQRIIEEFYALLEDSVKLRLVSDVPVGIYLSGGLDSSAILGLMSNFVNERIKSLAIGFDASTDELSKSQRIGSLYGTDHSVTRMKAEDLNLLPKVLWHLDEPYGDLIAVPMYILSKMAQGKVKVVLTGEGADELLGGYVYQKTMYWGYLFSRLVPGIIRKAVFLNLLKITPPAALNAFFHYPARLGQSGKRRLEQYLSKIDCPQESYLSLTGLFTNEEKRELYAAEFKQGLSKESYPEDMIREYFSQRHSNGYFDQLLALEFRNWLPDNILFTQDKMAMAHGIETRVPFLDHRLVELAFTLPSNLKLNKLFNDKYILRKATARFINRKIAKSKKQAFRVPIEDKFESSFEDLIHEYLSEKRIKNRGYFDPHYIGKIISSRKNDFLANMKVASLLMFEIWLEVFVDNKGIVN